MIRSEATPPSSGPRLADARACALAALEAFLSRSFPSSLRRLARWKGLDSRRDAQVVDDLRQELALDALEHAVEIASLSDRARHARWFRLVHSTHYRLCQRAARRETRPADGSVLDGLADPTPPAGSDWSATTGGTQGRATRTELDRVAEAAVHFGNGRLNVGATATALGLTKRQFVSRWERLTEALGFGSDYVAFWRRRLREAAVSLAADRLEELDALHTFGTAQRARRSDPAAGLRRLRRARVALSSHPHRTEVQRVLRAASTIRGLDPIELLDAVAALAAGPCVTLELWRFEAALASGAAGRAARHLDDARSATGSARTDVRVPIALAAARMAEADGSLSKARAELRSAIAQGADARLSASLRSLESA